jgi:hypothetical protein
MTRFVRNDGGTVHSVPDDFDLPEGWEDTTEADASPELLGAGTDPAVDAVELHDRAETPVLDESGPAESPGVAVPVPDADGAPVAEPATTTKEAPVV